MAFASIKAKVGGGKDFDPIPAGIHLAICTQVVDLGWQPGSGKYPRPKHQVYLKFEIPGHVVEWEKDGKRMSGPGTIGRKFGLSLSDKGHLRPFLVGWRGKQFTAEEEEGFEITSVIGKVCQLNVIHEQGESNGKTYAKIASAFGLVKEQKEALAKDPSRAKPQGDLIVYSPEAHDQAMFDKLPEWMQEVINGRVDDPNTKAADDFDQTATTSSTTEDFNDDIPF
jgi:hypothetical protein